jgi:ABC-type transport system involved in multi-copper enzyme maturation permease subunit
VLLMTPITAWQIVAGKLFSRLLVAFTLIGLSLPVLALVRLLGGVEASQMFGVICLCAVMALVGAALGLFFSSFIDRAYATILLSYATILILYLFVPFVMALTIFRTGGVRSTQLLSVINPFYTTGVLAWGEVQRMLGTPQWVYCVLLHLAFAALLIFLAGVDIRRRARRAGERPAAVDPSSYIPIAAIAEPESAGNADVDAQSPPALPPPLPYANVQLPTRKHIAQRTVSDNPVLWREVRRPLMAKRWQAIVGAILCIILLLITYGLLADVNALNDEETQIGYSFVFNALMMLLVCVISGTAIAQEKESDTWTLLLATPISGWDIVWGKVLGQLRKLMWPMALIVAHFGVFTLAGVINVQTFFLVIWTIATFNFIWIATGIYLSLRIHKVTFAVILNLLLPVIIYIAVPIVLLILGELINNNDDWAEAVGWYLPYYYMGIGLDDMNRSEVNMPTGGQFSYAAFFASNIIAGVVHLIVATGILTHVAVYFDKLVGRANQRHNLALRLSDQNVSRLTS